MFTAIFSSLVRGISGYPALWPALLFPFFVFLIASLSRSPRFTGFYARHRFPIFVCGATACLTLYGYTALVYLFSSAFFDLFESREASVAALFLRGGAIYPELSSPERYASPYGPAFYLIVAFSQNVLGASVFSTKLPSVLAGFLAILIFGLALYRQGASARVIWTVLGLEAALLLPFRQLTFWSKSDSLILLSVSVGIYLALQRNKVAPALLGLCVGVAMNFKLHALAYFLPVAVMAIQNDWRWRAGCVAAGMAAISLVSPFLWFPQQISAANYAAYLHMTAREGFGPSETFGFCRWILLLTAMVLLSDQLVRYPQAATAQEKRLRKAFRTALALSVVLITVPGCAIGAGQAHLMPLIPLFLLAAGDRFPRGIAGVWDRSPNLFLRAAAYSSLAACALVALTTAWRMTAFHARTELAAQKCRAEIRVLLARYSRATVLFGAGGDADLFPTTFRQEAVFAGHPIGLDVAAVADYQQGRLPPPDLDRLLAAYRLRQPSPVVWVLPHGSHPFTQTNLYDHRRSIYPVDFRRSFHTRFTLGEQSPCYDVYLPNVEAVASREL